MILKKITFLAVFSVLLLVATAAAKEVELSLSSTDLVGYTNDVQSVDITIRNNQDKTDTVSLSVWPPQFAGVGATLDKYLVTVAAKSSETVKLFFGVAIDAEEVVPIFTVSVKSTTNEIFADSQNLYLRIIRKTTVYIKDVRLEKYTLNPEDTAKIDIDVTNIADTPSGKYSLETLIKKSGNIVKRFDDTLDGIAPRSTTTISKTYNFGRYDEPGTYAVETVVRDSNNMIVSSKSTNININAIYKLPTEYTSKDTDYSVVLITMKIIVKNEGNLATPSFYVTESIPGFVKSLFDPEIEPTSETVKGSRVVYSWLVPPLGPGKQITIVYKFTIWRIWLAALIVGGIIYFSFKFFYKPSLVKRYRHEGEIRRGKEISIILEVRNRTKHEIRDAEVRDFVPSIAKVVEKFETLRPRIKSTEGGTELRWSFDSLRAREERVIVYKIVPVVDVIGSLHLPNAHVKYSDRRKIKRMLASKSLAVKPS